VKHIVGVCVLAAFGSAAVPGQTAAVPEKWIGTWTLNLQESKFGPSWGPGFPDGTTITSQTLKISVATGHLKGAGDTVTSQYGSSHDEFDVSLDGTETEIVPAPGVTISTKRIDDTGFEIIVKDSRNRAGHNRFVFADDGKKLTEIKTYTEQVHGAVTRTSTSVLVFYRVLASK
jgi:hypothetical protein